MDKTTNLDSLTDILSRMDDQADEAAWIIKNYSEAQAEAVLDAVLKGLSDRWKGDQIEATARRLWLRSEILRRIPKVGRA